MKALLPIFILFISLSTFAQNYRTANTSSINYYENSINSSSSLPFKCDNFTVESNGDTLISFLEIFGIPFRGDPNSGCLDTAFIPWQGEKVLLKSDGTDIYYNENNESIIIKTQANIGDTWLFFDGNVKLEATLLDITTQSIFGVIDSVKTFSIQAIASNNNPISNVLNNTIYTFSKNFGLVEAADFYNYPSEQKCILTGIQSQKLGIYNITKNDIYNFEVNDEFHIKDANSFTSLYYKIIILSKQLDSTNHWAYTYKVGRSIMEQNDTAVEISKSVPRQLIPETTHDLSPLPNTFYQDDNPQSAYTLIQKTTINNKNLKKVDKTSWYKTGDCWSFSLVQASHPDIYIEGLGGPYGGSPVGGVGFVTSLEYYKRGNETYGTPIDFGSILPIFSDSNEALKIYPNPATDFITIELENQSIIGFNILIVNNLGQIISQGILTQNFQQIPVNHLPKGIYTLHIRNEEAVFVKQFMKE